MRGNAPKHLLTFFALSIAASPAVLAQGKIRVAIWEFENHAENHWWFWNNLGPAARNQIDTEFSENQLLSSKFSVVERDKLKLALQEQGLATAGAVDPTTAAKVGRILGVKYVVTGGIDKFNIENTKGSLGMFGVGGYMVNSSATINLRFIDTTTAERVVSISADGAVKTGGGSLSGASLSRDTEWGIASETIQKTAKAVVVKLESGEYLARISTAGTGSACSRWARRSSTRTPARSWARTSGRPATARSSRCRASSRSSTSRGPRSRRTPSGSSSASFRRRGRSSAPALAREGLHSLDHLPGDQTRLLHHALAPEAGVIAHRGRGRHRDRLRRPGRLRGEVDRIGLHGQGGLEAPGHVLPERGDPGLDADVGLRRVAHAAQPGLLQGFVHRGPKRAAHFSRPRALEEHRRHGRHCSGARRAAGHGHGGIPGSFARLASGLGDGAQRRR